jgi:hypothetical protein
MDWRPLWGFRVWWCVWCCAAVVAFTCLLVGVQFWKGEYYVVSKLFAFVCSFNWVSSCQRARADIVFLTLDGLAFGHFPLSLLTFTLRISEEVYCFHYKEIVSDNCQFLFQQQSSLVRFLNNVFYFSTSVFSFLSVV